MVSILNRAAVGATSRVFFVCILIALSTAVPLNAAQYSISQKDKTFSTTRLVVKAGDSVVFKNDDDVTHSVFSSTDGRQFSARPQAPGGTTSIVFKTDGMIEVKCAFHPAMKLIITVKK